MQWMRLLPKGALSSAVGAATRSPMPAVLHRAAMRAFARHYGVEVTESEKDYSGYQTFAEFFSRRLRQGARSVEGGDTVVVSPVDGAVSQVGTVQNGQCIQAKGIAFPVRELLGDPKEAGPFEGGGAFITLYLAPKDYHRIHAPLAGAVEAYHYIPGQFWPVNPASVRNMPALFCLNERLITYLRTPAGLCAVVKVGATCVARIRASYDGMVTHSGGRAKVHQYASPLPIKKGEELGAFEMGSTVILLFEPGKVRWDTGLGPEARVRMGQRIGALV